jgi:hypothetical protein
MIDYLYLVCTYRINRIWKCLESYNDAAVEYVKDEKETDIANFLQTL